MLAANAVQGLGSLMQAIASDEYAFGRAGTAVKGFGDDLEAGIADIPMWQAALAALAIGGFAFLIAKTWDSTGATQAWISSTNARCPGCQQPGRGGRGGECPGG